MRRREALKLFAGLALCPLCAPNGFAADWSYEGAGGPDKWGELDPANKACSIGGQQSPVNIGETIKAQLPPLKIAWGKSAEIDPQHRQYHPDQYARWQHHVGRRRHLPPTAIPFPPPERAHDQRRKFSDGGAFRPRQRGGQSRGRRRADDHRPHQQGVQHHRPDDAEPGRFAGQGGSERRSERLPAAEAQLLPLRRLARPSRLVPRPSTGSC